MGEIDGVGEMVTGGLLAQAIEPETGDDGHTHEGNCLNCGVRLSGPYCAACGQKAHIHRSLAAFFHDMIQGLFNFEGKIWRTLPMLAWRPGELTRRYIAGERARFVSPVALYLFSVFAMFAVLNFNGMTTDPGSIKANIDIAAREERGDLANLEGERKAALAEGKDTKAIDRQIASTKEDLARLEEVKRGQLVRLNDNEANEVPPWVREVVERTQANPELAVAKVQDASSKFSWLLIPLSVPFLWLLFPLNRRYRLYDHTVFVTYSLSFMMALVIAGGLLVAAGAPSIASMLIFVPPIHMYRQLKGGYGLSRTGALLRTVALVTFAMVAAILFFMTTVAIGVM